MGLTITRVEKPTVLADLTDNQLFEAMSNRGSKPNEARIAWKEFYFRYAKYVWNRCLNQCKTVPEGDALAKDIFQTTMEKIYDNADKFDSAKNIGIKGWLSTIIRNEFIDHIKKYHLKFTSEIPEVAEENEDEEYDLLSEKIANLKFDQLRELLSHLTEKEYDVLIVYMSNFQIDNPNAHLPDSEMKKLREKYGISPEAFRQIKRRAIIKLKKAALSSLTQDKTH